MSALTGQVFAKWLAGADEPALDGRAASDRVEVQGCLGIGKGIPVQQHLLKNLDFLDDLDLSNCRFASRLEIVDCRFKGRLILDEAIVEGSLHLRGASFDTASANSAAAHISLSHAEVKGSLVVDDLSGEGDGRGPAVSLEGATISGRVSLGSRPEKRLGSVSGRNARVGTDLEIGAQNVEIEGAAGEALDLRGLRLGGSLSLAGKNSGQLRVGGRVNLANARIEGNLIMRDIVVTGGLDIRSIQVSGNVELSRSPGPGGSFQISEGIAASDAHVDGNATITGVTIGRLGGAAVALDLTNASIGGIFALTAIPETAGGELTLQGDLRCRGLRGLGGVNLAGVAIQGDAQFDGAELPGGLWMQPVGWHRPYVAKRLLLSAVRGRPWITFRGVSVEGGLMLLASDISVLQITPAWVGEYGELDVVLPRAGRLLMRATHVHGWCDFSFLQIDGTVTSYGIQGVHIDGSTIEGDLLFWSPTTLADLLQQRRERPQEPDSSINPFEHSAAVIGPVSIANSVINGTLNLSFLKASGPLRLTDNHVKGDVLFRSTQTVALTLPATDLKEKARFEDANDPLRRAALCGATMRMLRVDNDIDLTGLSVFRDDSVGKWPFGQPGSIDAGQLQAVGEIKAYAQSGGKDVYVEAPGQLDLRKVEAGSLVISGHSFPLDRPAPPTKPIPWWRQALQPRLRPPKSHDGLVLSDGKIGTVSIPSIEPEATGRPFPVALDGLRVDVWEIGESQDGVDCDVFRQLLEKDQTFRRSTYKSIESYLRNRGEEDSADFIYREMWRRERRDADAGESRAGRYLRLITVPVGNAASAISFPPLRIAWTRATKKAQTLWWWLYGTLLRYGTSPMRLLGVIAILGLLAFPLYRHPANVEPSLDRLGVEWDRDKDGAMPPARYNVSPELADWSAIDALALLIRYHIPIVPSSLRDEWTMRNDHGTIYDPAVWSASRPVCQAAKDSSAAPAPASKDTPVRLCEDSSAIVLSVAAEDIVSVLMVLNYAMWPLLLAFLIRRLLRH